MPRSHDKYVNVLATLPYKVDFPGEIVDVGIIKSTFWGTPMDLILLIFLMRNIGNIPLFRTWFSHLQTWPRGLQGFYSHYDEPYHRGNGRPLTGDLSLSGAKEELELTHDLSCGENNISLYRSTTVRILLRMAKNIANMLIACIRTTYRGVFICPRNWILETALSRFF